MNTANRNAGQPDFNVNYLNTQPYYTINWRPNSPMNHKISSLKIGDRTIKLTIPGNRKESEDRISFWWGVTTSSIALSEEILKKGNLSKLDVLELGSGIGLSGIAAALAGARVVFSDYVQDALEHCRTNCELNLDSLETVDFMRLDWENPGELTRFHMIIGAEILYDYFFHSSLIRILNGALKPGGLVILADRKRLVVSRFMGEMTRQGFLCKEQSQIVDRPGFPKQSVSVFQCRGQDGDKGWNL